MKTKSELPECPVANYCISVRRKMKIVDFAQLESGPLAV